MDVISSERTMQDRGRIDNEDLRDANDPAGSGSGSDIVDTELDGAAPVCVILDCPSDGFTGVDIGRPDFE